MNERSSMVLTLSCGNRPGIVASITAILYELGWNILESQQFDDVDGGRFFMRVAFDRQDGDAAAIERTGLALGAAAKAMGATATLRDASARRRVAILASKSDHCLADLIYRWRIGELPMDISAIISNHPAQTYQAVDLKGMPFHHVPVGEGGKPEQEAEIARILIESKAELVVLARYMQVLSDGFARSLVGRCINIHHSFLPGFKGAKPYHQAHARGVKLIGATAHYVTPDLDEGPIIEQDVERISHRDTPEDLVRKGRDIERRVLARAVLAHLEDRVIQNGDKTVVFS
mgnify:CR=1 FL=1